MNHTKLNTHDKTLINKILWNSMEFYGIPNTPILYIITLSLYYACYYRYPFAVTTLAITVTHLPLLRLLSTLAFCKISEKVLDTNFTPSIKKNEML